MKGIFTQQITNKMKWIEWKMKNEKNEIKIEKGSGQCGHLRKKYQCDSNAIISRFVVSS